MFNICPRCNMPILFWQNIIFNDNPKMNKFVHVKCEQKSIKKMCEEIIEYNIYNFKLSELEKDCNKNMLKVRPIHFKILNGIRLEC